MTVPPVPSLLVRLVWVAIALATFVRAGRVWRRLVAVQESEAGRRAQPRVRVWSQALTSAAWGLAVVALCNLLAGLLSLWLVFFPPKDGRAPAVMPLLFIVSAAVKLHVVSALDDGYRRVVGAKP